MQTEIKFEIEESTGEELRDAGIKKAIESAETIVENWSEKAYAMFVQYTKKVIKFRTIKAFMTEDFRKYCDDNGLPKPASERAYGWVVRKACSEGLIKRVGYAPVQNPKAHCTPATIWELI